MTRWMQAVVTVTAVTAALAGLGLWSVNIGPGGSPALAQEAQETAPTNAAVVDLDAVAKAIGKDEEISEQIDAAVQQINERLVEAAQQMQQQLQEEREALGDDPDEEQVARLRQMALQARQNVQNNRTLAELRRDEVRKELIQQFREEARPVAERVAKERGANVVLLANDNVLWYEAAADITGAVITEMRSND